ncbi:hypothetical protein RD792_010973 [Penstemon davidsonii]|uniref:Exostosin GT47 domain-containing protein n=1 Tax=Penstemon davidsonii TaxID=160366 RepID=A0ABR0D3H7_9LAMI|nr:hypothetical protein RD792_010973 [Penstemon davidsonii]
MVSSVHPQPKFFNPSFVIASVIKENISSSDHTGLEESARVGEIIPSASSVAIRPDFGSSLSPEILNDLFYLPFSIASLRHDKRIGVGGIKDFVKNYIIGISERYPFWNRSGGADHFYVACHSVGRTAMDKAAEVKLNAIQVVCSSSYFLGGYVAHKDASVPQIWPRKGKPPIRLPSQRKKLAFYAGAMNSKVREFLVKIWKHDSDISVHQSRLKTPYSEALLGSKFCIHAKGFEVNTARIGDALYYGCVPVILADFYDLPFADILNWESFAVVLSTMDVPMLKEILQRKILSGEYLKLQSNVMRIQKHFQWHDLPVDYDAFHMVMGNGNFSERGGVLGNTEVQSPPKIHMVSHGSGMYINDKKPFHDNDIFLENYKEMNKTLKIYVYPHTQDDPFANVLLPVDFEPGGNYASESYFKKVLMTSHFITKEPSKADLFFLPFSIARLRHDPRVGINGIQDFVKDYIFNISHKYPYWNRSGGADHFYVACHSIGRSAMEKVVEVKLNAIQIVCSSNYYLSSYVAHKDASLPQIWPRQGDPPNLALERTKLVFFAGSINSPVREKLLQVWGNDSEISVHFGRINTSYSEELLTSKFCLHVKGYEVNTARIGDALYYGCVPVIIANHYDLPFQDVLNWKSFSIVVATKKLAFYAGAMNSKVREFLVKIWKHDSDISVHQSRLKTPYSEALLGSKFCIHAKGFEVNTARIGDALYYGCVPVILADFYDLPFADILNWESFAVVLSTMDVPMLKEILQRKILSGEYLKLQSNVMRIQKHFQWHDLPVDYDAFHMVMGNGHFSERGGVLGKTEVQSTPKIHMVSHGSGTYINDKKPFHDNDIFLENYKEMNKTLKIYVYPHTQDDPFANVLLPVDFEPGGNYASESYFKKVLMTSHFITKEPSKADLFFLPFSIARLRHDPRVGINGIQDFVKDYIFNISHKYPYWNRSGGADHFYVACHSIGRSAMEKVVEVKLNAIQIVCSSNYYLSSYVAHKDASLPQIWPRQGDPPNLALERCVMIFTP